METDVGGLLTEALTADVQAVLADETGLVGADTAVRKKRPMLAPAILIVQYLLDLAISICAIPPILFQRGVNVPLAAALAVGARARVPDRLVGHVDGVLAWGGRGASSGGDLKL